MFKLLVIDDDPEMRALVETVFNEPNVRVLGAASGAEGLRMAAEHEPDVVLLDLKLGDRDGLDVFDRLRTNDSRVLVIFITGHGTSDTAIESMKRGAHEYLVKPIEVTELEKVVRQAFEISRLMSVPAFVEAGDRAEDLPDQIIGRGPAMQTICKEIGRVAGQDVNVLILGESGTGKELVARAIYHHSRRSRAPFLAINCAAIPEALLESELFGHEKGAFTGADRRRIGKFEQADGGILLLDEVGDMAPATQAKILRLLEERSFERVGGNETITADVRILAATNQDLESLIEQGKFRKDLYYRLRGVTIHLPPLRERREDIPQLAHYFLFRYNRELGTSIQSIAGETMARLMQYDWPGNVRELQSVIREALLRSSGAVLLPEFIPPELTPNKPAAVEPGGAPSGSAGPAAELATNNIPAAETAPPPGTQNEADWQLLPRLLETWLAQGGTDLYHRGHERFDRLFLSRTLQHVGGNQTRAAEILGMSRRTLREKLRAMGLAVEKVVAPHAPARVHDDAGSEQEQ